MEEKKCGGNEEPAKRGWRDEVLLVILLGLRGRAGREGGGIERFEKTRNETKWNETKHGRRLIYSLDVPRNFAYNVRIHRLFLFLVFEELKAGKPFAPIYPKIIRVDMK